MIKSAYSYEDLLAAGRGELFGTERVDGILRMACRQPPQSIIDTLVQEIERFTGGADPTDDRTLVVAKVE